MRSNFKLFSLETEMAIAPAFRAHLPKVQDQLERYLSQEAELANDLAHVSRQGLLRPYLQAPAQVQILSNGTVRTATKTRLIDLTDRDLDRTFRHMPIVMALAHEGGKIDDLFAKGGADGLMPDALIKRLCNLSPQQFIMTSGLLPGSKANRMYIDLFKSVLKTRSTEVIKHLWDNVDAQGQHYRQWREAIRALTGHEFFDERLMGLGPSYLKTVMTPPDQFCVDDYRRLINHQCPGRANIDETMLDLLYFTEAFALLETCADHVLAIRVLKAKAMVWAERAELVNGDETNDLAEQLLACALVTHPEHYRAAGCGHRNLLGLSKREPWSPTLKFMKIRMVADDLFDGPLAYFSRGRPEKRKTFFFEALMSAFKSIEPEFSATSLIEQRGFSHLATLGLVKSMGGHAPVIDAVLMDGDFPIDSGAQWLQMIKGADAYKQYQVNSLVKLLHTQLESVSFFDSANSQSPNEPHKTHTTSKGQQINQLTYTRDTHFAPAYAKVPELRSAVIEHLRGLNGVTSQHLIMAGISASEVPDIVRKMPLQMSGELFASDLGL